MAGNILKRALARRENIPSLIAAGSALIVVGLNIFTDDIVTEPVLFGAIVLLLGLLAAGGSLEREQTLLSTEKALAGVESELEAKLDILRNEVEGLKSDLFLTSDDLMPFSEYISGADEVFCAGGHLMGFIVERSALWERWLGPGKRLKVIVQDPDNPGLDHLEMPCGLYNAEEYRRQIRVTLGRLKALQSEFPKAEIQVKLTSVTPSQSISILDGHRDGTRMTVLFHVPEGDATVTPFIVLNRAQHPKWSNMFYHRYYIRLWKKSAKYI